MAITRGRLFLGTSGWGAREWRGILYPPDLPPERQLAHYAEHFTAVEANSTAYGLPSAASVARWRAAMPAGFAMAIKAPHEITHRRRLADCAEPLAALLERIRPLADARGPLLFQLPPGFAPDADRLARFLDLVAAALVGDPLRIAIEFRHPGWLAPAIRALLDARGVACCLGDMPSAINREPTPGAGFLYMRRHGPLGTYRGSYSSDALQADAAVIGPWLEQGRDAYVFLNNTIAGAAIGDARILGRLLGGGDR